MSDRPATADETTEPTVTDALPVGLPATAADTDTVTEPDAAAAPEPAGGAAVTATDPGTAAPARRVRRFGVASILFVVLGAIFGTAFAVLTPPFWGHDELTQFGRAYQVAEGGFLPQEIHDDRAVAYGGQVPASIDALMDFALTDYRENDKEPAPMVADPSGYDRLEGAAVDGPPVDVWFTNTAAYSPVPYAPVAAGLRVAEALDLDVGGTLLAARLAGLAAYLALAGFALHVLRGSRIAWLAFTLALLPIAMFQAGTVTADTVTNGMALLFSALFVKAVFLRDRLSKPESLVLLASVLALPLCKPTYFLLAMLVVFVPRDRLAGLPAVRWVPQLTALVGLGLFGLWTKISSGTTEGMGLMRPQNQWYSVIPADQMQGILSDPLGFLDTFYRTLVYRDQLYFVQFFGELGFGYVDVPATAIVLALTAIILAFGIAERLDPRRWSTTATTLVVLLSVGMIFGTLYLSFSPVGFYIIDGVQGRYFLPLAFVGFTVLLRWIPLRITVSDGRAPGRGVPIAIALLTVGSLVATLLKYNTVVWG
ncbi:DUF2142 domain-containing protein [Rhodococcus sp. NPDC003348]